MNNYSLQSLYYKIHVKSNFINIKKNWILLKDTSFDKILLTFQCNPKKYNKKMFSVLILIMEYLTRGIYLNQQNISFYSKNNKNSSKININYILNIKKIFIFFDNFITDFYWLNFNNFFNKNKTYLSVKKLYTISISLTKMLDLTNLIQNKIQFEKYFLKKSYKFKLSFVSLNHIYYMWWLKLIGFPKFKNEYNL